MLRNHRREATVGKFAYRGIHDEGQEGTLAVTVGEMHEEEMRARRV